MGCFILGVNIKYMLFSILYGHINAPVACKELRVTNIAELDSLNDYPLGDGPISPTGQFK